MMRKSPQIFFTKASPIVIGALVLTLMMLSFGWNAQVARADTAPAINFSTKQLGNVSLAFPTSLDFGPDGRLYISEVAGAIKVLTVERDTGGNYTVTAEETINLVASLPNRNDIGEPVAEAGRQVTGLTVAGTETDPIIYVSSSHPNRLLNNSDAVLPVDTNSGIISRLTYNGTEWEKVDLVRGLPRSAEYHATNGLQYDAIRNVLYVASGGHTNMGAPASSLSFVPEYALSAAILEVDLTAIEAMPIQDPTGTHPYIYDLPTLDDSSRANIGATATDINDPFGGHRGENQAIIDPSGPVQVYAPGFRNAYDVVLTEARRLYTIDNGPNAGFGGFMVGEADFPGAGAGACSNTQNEGGSYTGWDNLHLVEAGVYAGHPNPARGNTSNTFGGVSPVISANPIECDFRWSGNGSNAPQDGALATWGDSTNGLTEYTATNFAGQMTGDLLAASYNSTIQRIELNNDGDAAENVTTFAPQSGRPLDVTAQSDFDVFPGTVWAISMINGRVYVYEPADYGGIDPGLCDDTNSDTIDADGDGYTNADELTPANSTSPCNSASRPFDNDAADGPEAGGFLISDVNDPDDDNDGINDEVDFFQVDAQNGVDLPVTFDFDPGGANFGTGLLGSGFTGMMSNGSDNYLDLFEPTEMTVGGIAKVFVIDDVPAGNATTNDQSYAFHIGINTDNTSEPFTIATRLGQPFFNDAVPVGNQSQGVYIGTGDQDNYIKLVVGANGMQLITEDNGAVSSQTYTTPPLFGSSYIDLVLSIDPANGTLRPRYGLANGNFVELEATPINITNADILSALQSNSAALAAGIIATSEGGSTYTAIWDSFYITEDSPGTLAFSESTLDFGAVELNQSVIRTVTLQNVGIASDPSINITDLNINGGGEFNILSPSLPLTLDPQGTVDVQIEFAPTVFGAPVATVEVTHTGANAPTVSLSASAYEIGEVLYRVNAGGNSEVADTPIPWSADNRGQGGSPYLASPNNDSRTYGSNNVGNNATSAPNAIFTRERWDPPGGTEQAWSFPIDEGDYELRLYFAEIAGSNSPGSRVFDILVEGQLAVDNFDQFVAAGNSRDAVMLSFPVSIVGTGESIDFELQHVVENPAVKGIEIVSIVTGGEGLVVASPPELDFGTQDIDTESNPQIITITNTGTNTPVEISSVTFIGGATGRFNHDFTGITTLNPGETLDLNVTFAPNSNTGTRNSTLTITHDGVDSPIEVAVTGQAVEPASPLFANISTVDFGTRIANNNATYTRTISLENEGEVGDPAVEVTDVQIIGPDASEFTTNFTGSLTINQGATNTLDVFFTPISGSAKTASVVITHDGENSPTTVNLTALGYVEGTPIYRVNAGGATLIDGDGLLNWSSDEQGAPSQYVDVAGSNRTYAAAFNGTNSFDVPDNLFASERWYQNGNMNWRFPVEAGDYEVRMYFAEICACNQGVGERSFDISINGSTVETAFDQFDFAQRYTGSGLNASMRAYQVNMATAGDLNISLIKGIENVSIKGIEILSLMPLAPNSLNTSVDLTGSLIDFGVRDLGAEGIESITLTNSGLIGDPDIEVTSVSITGADADDFTHKFNLPGGAGLMAQGGVFLAPQESYTFDVSFEREDEGQSTAQMTIMHTGDNSPLVIALSGQMEPQETPRITTTDPVDGETDVSILSGVGATLFLPNEGDGVDANTLNASTIIMTKVSTGEVIPSSYGTSGGSDVINISPLNPLEPFTTYQVEYTDGIRTAVTGTPFQPYVMTFTTGEGDIPPPIEGVAFEQVATNSTNRLYTSVDIGPDGRLYATAFGNIYHWDILADGQLTKETPIAIGPYVPVGFDFDPRSTADSPIIWVTINFPALEAAPHFSGGLMKLVGFDVGTPGENWEVTEYITGFPRSVRDHLTNSAAFGPDGGLYILQGGISAMGERDNAWGLEPETVLSAAMLRVDIDLLEAYYAANGVLNVATGTATGDPDNPVGNDLEDEFNYGLGDPEIVSGPYYNPQAPDAPVTLYATGIRNAYDLVWHSNGTLYSATNGSQGGGRTPATPGVLPNSCKVRIDDAIYGDYNGPSVPETIPPTQNDYLFIVEEGGYYGHPNPTHCEWVLNGGNPTAGEDPMQIGDHYPIGTLPDRNWRGFAFDFGPNKSPNGSIEYRSDTFGGALQGAIIVTRWSQRDDLIVLQPGNNSPEIVNSSELIPGFTGLGDPLDLTEDLNNGNLYVIEYNPGKITLLRPINGSQPNIVASPTPTYLNAPVGATSEARTVTISNAGSADLTISNITTTGPFNVASGYNSVVPAGSFTTVDVTFQPSVAGPQTGQLRISSDDPDQPVAVVSLRGLAATNGTEDGEPSLQWILNTYTIPVTVGDDAPATSIINSTQFDELYLGQEVPIELFQKAGPGSVTIDLLAVYTNNPAGVDPVVQLDWYIQGDSANPNPLFTINNGQNRTLTPLFTGALSFDPGAVEFGFATEWPNYNRTVYMEDALNVFNNAIPHHVRIYPYRDNSGVVANTYIVVFEEKQTGYDYQDLVIVVHNVAPASSTASPIVVSPERLIFSDITGGGASDAKSVTITNNGSSDVEIYRLDVTDGEPYTITAPGSLPSPSSPLVISAGNSIDVDVVYNPTVTGPPDFASLTILSNATEPSVDVKLNGLSRSGNGGANEPSLQYILDTYEIGTDVGDDDPTTTDVHSSDEVATGLFMGDEVRIQLFQKASTGNVTIEPLAVFGLNGQDGDPPVSLGWYRPTTPGSPQILFDVDNPGRQSLDPPLRLGAVTSFDPGNDPFGMYTLWYPWDDRDIYQQDSLNNSFSDGGVPPIPHHMRIYPLKDAQGDTVPNAYVVAVEEYTQAYDFNDIVFIIRNVEQAETAGNGIQVENLQWAGLLDQNIPEMEWVNRWITFQEIHFPGDSPFLRHIDTQTVRIHNTLATNLSIFDIDITNNQAGLPGMVSAQSFVYSDTNGDPIPFPVIIPPGGFYDVQVEFVLHRNDPDGEIEVDTEQKGTYYDTMTIFSSDLSEPVLDITLAGAYMHRFEGPFEVFAQELIDAFGYLTELDYPFSSQYEARGDEVLSPIWEIQDPTKPIYVRQLAALHGGGTPSFQLLNAETDANFGNLRHATNHHQSLLPANEGSETEPAERTYTNTYVNGERIPFILRAAGNNHRSTSGIINFNNGDPNRHSLRLWPIRDRDGDLISGVYFVIQDYVGAGCGAGSANCDFNDNVYLVTNIQPSNDNDFGLTYNPDLTTNIIENGDPLQLGQELVYTVEARNLSLWQANDVQLSFNLPENANLVSVSSNIGSCVVNATVVSCNFGTLFGEGVGVATITLDPTAGGVVNVASSVTTSTTETNPDNNSVVASTTIIDPDNLPGRVTVIKEATPDSATPFPFTGDLGDFSVIDNGGQPSVVADINFQDDLDPLAGYEVVDDGSAFGTYTGPHGTYGWRRLNDGVAIDATENAVQRGSSYPVGVDQKTFIYMQLSDCCPNRETGVQDYIYWEYQLPNGTYDVTVSVGDTSWNSVHSHIIRAEGQVILGPFVPTEDERFEVVTATVVVNDGFLTIDPVGGTNTKLNYVRISGGTPLNQRDFDFVSPGSYTITENIPAQWQLDNVVCTGASGSITYLNDGVVLPVASGDDITCTFENSQVTGPLVDIDLSPSAQQIPIGADASFDVTVSNVGVVDLENLTITDGIVPTCDATYVSLAVGASETYTCTAPGITNDFTNIIEVSADPVGGGAAVFDTDSATVEVVNAALTIEKTTNTPQVLAGTNVTFDVTIFNGGDVNLTNISITDAETPTCNLTLSNLPAGTSQSYTCVEQNVTATFTNVIVATAELQGGTTVTAEDSALVVVGTNPTLDVNPTSLNFASVTVGETSGARTVALSNIGEGTLDVTDIAITGSTDFAVTPEGDLGPDLTTNTETLDVTFSPTSVGIQTATLVITHDGDNSPVTIQLTGQGVPTDLPDLIFSTDELRFTVERDTGVTTQGVGLRTSGDTTNFTLDITGAPAWLDSVTPTAGVTDENEPDFNIDVSIDNTGLVPGTYQYTITAFAAGYDSVTLPVILEVIPVQYTITPIVNGLGGTITPDAPFNASENSTVNLSVTPENTHYVDEVTVNGTPVAIDQNGGTVTISPVDDDQEVIATFIAKPSYTVSASAGAGGSITPNGDTIVLEGDDITFTVTANVGSTIDEVTIDDGSGPVPVTLDQNDQFTISDVQSDYTVEAIFNTVQTYTVFAGVGANGSINPSGEFDVNEGTVVSFSLTPAQGYEVERVTVNGVPIQVQFNAFDLTINQNTTIFATFRQFTVICNPLSSESCPDVIVPVSYSQPYCTAWDGTDVGLTDGSFNPLPTGFTMVDPPSNNLFPVTPSDPDVPGYEPSNLTVDRFARTLRITSTKGIQYWDEDNTTDTNSQVNALGVGFDASIATVIETTLINPVIPGNSGEQAGIWFGLDEDNYAKLVVTQNADQPRIQLMVEVNGGRFPDGVGAPLTSNSQPPVPLNDKVVTLRMIIDPATNQVTGEYSIDGGAATALGILNIPISFTNGQVLPDSVSVASFAGLFASHRNGATPVDAVFGDFCINRDQSLPTFTINASANFGGTISPVGDVLVAQGDSQVFDITPDTGYRIDEVIVNGVPLATPTNRYTFTNVNANASIEAVFAPIGTSYTIDATTLTPGGTITPSGSVNVPEGGSASFTITPEIGYVIDRVRVNGSPIGVVESYTFNNVTANQTIDVRFAAVPTHTVTVSANAGGTFSSNAGEFVSNVLTVNQGTNVTVDITTELGFGIGQVVINGSPVAIQPSYDFPNIAEDFTINVTFVPVATYTVTATSNNGGEVIPRTGTPSGGVLTVNQGATVTYDIVPFQGFRVTDVEINDVSVGVTTVYTFTNITADQTIDVTFEAFTPGSIAVIKDAQPNTTDTFTVNVTSDLGMDQTAELVDDGTTNSPVSIAVNFDEPNIDLPNGFNIQDTGAAYGVAGDFGWRSVNTGLPISAVVNTENRSFSQLADNYDPEEHGFVYMQLNDCCPNRDPGVQEYIYWEYELPNGIYNVTVSAGDVTSFANTTYLLRAEGIPVVGPFTPTDGNRFVNGTAQVVVSDGRLTIDPVGGTNNKINYVIIESVVLDGPNVSIYGNLPPAAYTLTEILPPDWGLNNLICNASDQTISIPTATATINMVEGEQVICTFVNAGNNPPVEVVNAGMTVDENSVDNAIAQAMLEYTDTEQGAAQITYTLDAEPTLGTLQLNDVDLGMGDTFTQEDINNGLVNYDHAGDETPTTDSFDFSVTDGFTSTPLTGTFTITITPVDDAPTEVVNAELTLVENTTAIIDLSLLRYRDEELPNGQLEYTVTTQPTEGTLSLTTFTQSQIGNDELTYQHTGAIGADSFEFSVTDGTNTVTGVIFNITIIETNDPPTIATNDGITVDEGSADNEIGQAALEATDEEQDPADIDYTVTSGPDHGTLSLTSFTQEDINNGLVTYTHNGDDEPDDSFEFSVTDGVSGTTPVTGEFIITVNPLNDDPVVVNNSMTVSEGSQDNVVTEDMLFSTDEDNSRGQLRYIVAVEPTYGTIALNGTDLVAGEEFTQADVRDGLVTYSHDGTDIPADSIEFTLTDQPAPANTGQNVVFTINVTLANDAPVLVSNTGTTVDENSVDNVITQAMLEYNDDDNTAATIIYTVTTQPVYGTLSLTSFSQQQLNDGLVTYSHDGTEDSTTDSFEFSVTDNIAPAEVGTFDIAINIVNDAPVELVNDPLNVVINAADGPVSQMLLEYTDEEQTNPVDLTYEVTTLPAEGTLELNDVAIVLNGTFTQEDINNGLVTYTNTGGVGAVDGFAFTLTDGTNNVAGNFVINVLDDNGIPTVVINNGLVVAEGSTNNPLSQAVLEYTDDQPATDVIYTITVLPDYGTLTLGGTALAVGNTFTQEDINNGLVAYSHDGTEEASDSFDFTVTDTVFGTTPVADSFTVTINPLDDAPELVINDGLTVDEDSTDNVITTAVLEYSDVDTTTDQLVYTITTLPASGTLYNNGLEIADNGTFSQEDIDNGLVTYDHNGDDTDDSFEYTLSDGNTGLTGTFVITVNSINDAPIANDDSATTALNSAVTVDVISNDTDADGTIDTATVTIVNPPGNGSVVVNGNGTVTYTPDTDYLGEDSFTYTVDDNNGATSNEATVTITVDQDANQAPVANNDTATTSLNAAVTIDVTNNDTDSDGSIDTTSVTIITNASNGTVVVNGDGTVTYTPDTDYSGEDSFTYTVDDNDGATSNAATVTVTIDEEANQSPIANDDSANTTVNTEVRINVLANDTDADGTIDNSTVTIVTEPSNGTATVNSNGRVTYTPDADYEGEDSFTYTVEDNDGATSNEATVTITVGGDPNQAPIANDDQASAPENGDVTINVLANDVDADDNLDRTTVRIVTQPSNGTATVNPNNGRIVYEPATDYSGIDSFTYTVSDTEGALSNQATVTIQVIGVNTAPQITTNTGLTLQIDTAAIITTAMLETTDVDNTPDQLIYTLVSAPVNGTLRLNNQVLSVNSNFRQSDIDNGALVYSHFGTATVTDAFTVTVSDSRASAGPATFNIAIDGVVSDIPNNLEVDGDLQGYPLLLEYSWIHMTDVNATNVPAQWYNVIVVRDGVEILNIWVEASEVCEGVICSVEFLDKTPPYIFEEGDYQWGVVAWTQDNTGEWVSSESDIATFTIGDTSSGGPGIEPITGIVIEPNQGRPTISWDYDPNATWAHIYVGNANGRIYLEWVEIATLDCTSGRCSFTPDMNPRGGTYDVWMRTWGPNGFSTGGIQGWEGPVSFTLPSTPPAEATGLQVTNAESGTPTFGWDGVANATWYQLWVGQHAGTNQATVTYHTQWYLAADLGCENMGPCEVTPEITLPNGVNYQWALRSWGPGGFSVGTLAEWTDLQTFNVNAETAVVPVPGSPNTTAQLAEPIFTWNSTPDTTWYEIWIGDGTNFNTYYQEWVSAEDLACLTLGEVCTLDFGTTVFPAGNYGWALRAYTPASISEWSPVVNFQVQ